MADWTYQIIDQSGKERKGNIVAESEAEAKNKLKMDGNMVISLTKATALTKEISFSVGGKVKPRDLSVFCRQFTSMVNAGVTILDTLDMLSDQTENKVMAKAIRGVHAEIQKGETLSDGLKKYPNVFPDIMVSMVAAGEASGKIDVAFDRMSAHFEKSAKLNGMIKKAAVYPIIVVIVAIAVVIVMLVKVIPSYSEMFNDLGTELPGITKAVVAMSDFVTGYWYIVIAVIAAIVIAIKLYKQTDSGQMFFGNLARKIPVFGKLNIKTAASNYARTLSTLVYSGLPMIEALALIVLSVIDWRTYEIPLGINIFILVLGILHVFLDHDNWSEYVIGFFCVSLFLEILLLVSGGRAIGGGDVKLMACAGLAIGWQNITLAFFLGCIIGSVIHLIRMKVTNAGNRLAMGPYLAAGIFISMLWGEKMISAYLTLAGF